MIKEYRKAYIEEFTQEKYQALMDDLKQRFGTVPGFKVAETPIFIPHKLRQRLFDATADIMKVINRPDFKELTQGAFYNDEIIVPNEDDHPKFIQMDFGICLDEQGELTPKLIELQGFPSLFYYQEALARTYRRHFDIPEGFSIHPNSITHAEFLELLRSEIVGDTDPKQVVILEVEPEKQATAIDFKATEIRLGVKTLCLTKLKKRGKTLFYLDEDGIEVKIEKIYNRVIFDELYQRPELKREFHFVDEVDVEWIGHPNWFFRISKYLMPFLKGDYVPKSYLLDKLESLPSDLQNYVLKPLYSFAGTGVQINVTKEIIDALPNKANYMLQEKVAYHPVVDTLDVPAKCEIRIMLIRSSKTNSMQIISNLVRLSKGEMVGVRHNKDKIWVGSSAGFFEI
ncbi:hypothetical protein [uncultured Eudoraea sp.]|uniref:hypothetical protein n=1 Tax=uncultured Eudoraea sp. TaxID=1035614 RepID=UPI00262BEF30|nr:hypothetical protein [uncultured Eudoraea sp.]